MRVMKKTIYTVRLGDYAPALCELTLPLLRRYADKIDAEFVIINERKYPEWSPGYEKMQIFDLGQKAKNDWNIYIDADALIHPDMIDLTAILPGDTCLTYAYDQGLVRWKPDRFFLRDGRYIGPGNWFTIASDWCIDIWHPIDDMTPKEVEAAITPTVLERRSGVIDSNHLIDDYAVGRNIAKYGLKYISGRELCERIKRPELQGLLWHQYALPTEAKLQVAKKTLSDWGLL